MFLAALFTPHLEVSASFRTAAIFNTLTTNVTVFRFLRSLAATQVMGFLVAPCREQSMQLGSR